MRRADKKAVGYKMVFKNGKTVSYGEETGESYSEVVLSRPARYIEASCFNKDEYSIKHHFTKLTYFDKDDRVIDS